MYGIVNCTLKNTKVDPDYWFNDLYHSNEKTENISIDFKKT